VFLFYFYSVLLYLDTDFFPDNLDFRSAERLTGDDGSLLTAGVCGIATDFLELY
jgi:hypothetical protein